MSLSIIQQLSARACVPAVSQPRGVAASAPPWPLVAWGRSVHSSTPRRSTAVRLAQGSQPAKRRLRAQPARAAAVLDQLAQGISNPVLRQAVKEPMAFWGGVTAGALGLTLSEDPLRTWIAETSAEAGVRDSPPGQIHEHERAVARLSPTPAKEVAPPEVRSSLAKYFQGAKPADQWLPGVKQALREHGFTGENSIAVVNTCRDEITKPLAQKIESTYGASFDINGLGCVLTCGVTGLKAGLSHCPVCAEGGREKYVFWSFPHIGVDTDGSIGKVKRPGREDSSAACGALVAALGELQTGKIESLLLDDGEHDPDDPEYSILKQRLANKCRGENVDQQALKGWQLPDLTKAAERMVTQDLEGLIAKAVDTSKADYAVVTGVQIHACTDESVSPDLRELVDFIWPSASYVVTNGQRRNILTNNGS